MYLEETNKEHGFFFGSIFRFFIINKCERKTTENRKSLKKTKKNHRSKIF